MNALNARLAGIMRDLTPKHRALLIFRSQANEEEPDPMVIKAFAPEEIIP